MRVLKFGGTSVGSVPSMKNVASIVSKGEESKIVVLSALSGTTNLLVETTKCLENGEPVKAKSYVDQIRDRHLAFCDELFENKAGIASEFIHQIMDTMLKWTDESFTKQHEKLFLVQGEILSTFIFKEFLESIGQQVEMLMAQDFMTLDSNKEPDLEITKLKLSGVLADKNGSGIFLTQGYVARNKDGGIDNLARGGSDYTATILGSILNVDEIQIWTDIDGMHNNDPRIVENTSPLSNLSFEEASELAYFGAKVLHPQCIVPAHANGVPVRIKNTMRPDAAGTLISEQSNTNHVKAIAAKDGITAIKIKSSRMVMAYGFLRRVFEVFEKYKTSIDMITTSEIAVSLTIDNDFYLPEIQDEIEAFGHVEVDADQTIICIVGDLIAEKKGLGRDIFKALDEVPIRMISYGGSRNNISLLVSSSRKKQALQQLHSLFEN